MLLREILLDELAMPLYVPQRPNRDSAGRAVEEAALYRSVVPVEEYSPHVRSADSVLREILVCHEVSRGQLVRMPRPEMPVRAIDDHRYLIGAFDGCVFPVALVVIERVRHPAAQPEAAPVRAFRDEVLRRILGCFAGPAPRVIGVASHLVGFVIDRRRGGDRAAADLIHVAVVRLQNRHPVARRGGSRVALRIRLAPDLAVPLGCVQRRRKAPLLETVTAHDRFRLLPDPLQGRHQYRQKQRDDRNDNKEFYQCKGAPFTHNDLMPAA